MMEQQLSHRELTAIRYDQLLKSHVMTRSSSPPDRSGSTRLQFKSNAHLSQRLPPQQVEPDSPLRKKKYIKPRSPSPKRLDGSGKIKRVSISEPLPPRHSPIEDLIEDGVEEVPVSNEIDSRLEDDSYDWLHSPEADQFLVSARSINPEDPSPSMSLSITEWKENVASLESFLRNSKFNAIRGEKPTAFVASVVPDGLSMRELNLKVHSLREKLALEQNSSIHSCNAELKEIVDTHSKKLIFTAESCISELLDVGEEERRIRREIEGSQGLVPQIKRSVAATEEVMRRIDSCRDHIVNVKNSIDDIHEQLREEAHKKEKTQLSSKQVVFATDAIAVEIKTDAEIKELQKSRHQNNMAALYFVERFSLRVLSRCFQTLRRHARKQSRIVAFRVQQAARHRRSVLGVCYRLWVQCVRTLKCGRILTTRVVRKCGRCTLRVWHQAYLAKRRVSQCDAVKPVGRLHLRRAFQFLRQWKNHCLLSRRITARHGLYVTLFTVVRVLRCWRRFNLEERERSAQMWMTLWNGRLRRLLRAWHCVVHGLRGELQERVLQVLGAKKRRCFRKYFGSWLTFHRFRHHLLVYKRKQLGVLAFRRAVKSFGKQSRASQRVRLDCIQRTDIRSVVGTVTSDDATAAAAGESCVELPQHLNRRVLRLIRLRIHFHWFCQHIRTSRKLSRAKEIVARGVIQRLTSHHFEVWYRCRRTRAHLLHKMERAVATSVAQRTLSQKLRSWYFLWQCGPDEIKPAKLRQQLQHLRQQNAALKYSNNAVSVSFVHSQLPPPSQVSMVGSPRVGTVQEKFVTLQEDHCYPFEECDDTDEEDLSPVVDNNLDIFGQPTILNLASTESEGEAVSPVLFAAHKIWLRAALHRWNKRTSRQQLLQQRGGRVRNYQMQWVQRRCLTSWHALWLTTASSRFKMMSSVVGKESQLGDDSTRFELQLAKERAVEKIQADKKVSDQLQHQIDELEASLSQVCLELDAVQHIERDVHASLVALNRQNQQACERHAALLERCQSLQEMRELVLQQQQKQTEVNDGCLPVSVEALSAEHFDNRFLLMRDVENLYQRAVQTQAEMVKQRELMANKTKSVKHQMALDRAELTKLEAAIDRLTASRVATEQSVRVCTSTVEETLSKQSEENKRREVRMEQLDAEKLQLEEKLAALYEMESKMRSHIEQFSPTLLPPLPPRDNGRMGSKIACHALDKQSMFQPTQLAEYDLLSLDYLNSSVAITEVDEASDAAAAATTTTSAAVELTATPPLSVTSNLKEDVLCSSADLLLKQAELAVSGGLLPPPLSMFDKENVVNYSGLSGATTGVFGATASLTSSGKRSGSSGVAVGTVGLKRKNSVGKGLKKRITATPAVTMSSGALVRAGSGGDLTAAAGGKRVKRIEDQIDAIYQRISSRLTSAPV